MIVFFSTVVRTAPPKRGGEIVKLDWDRKQVLGSRPVFADFPSIEDPNPRGGTRGGRGIALRDGEVLVASYHTIHRLDPDLDERGRLTHPQFANIHEIAWENGDLWITSTDIDAAIRVDLEGVQTASWWPRDDQVTAGHFELPPSPVDRETDNRTRFVGTDITRAGHVHLNAAAVLSGRPIMLLNRCGAVVALNPTEVLIEHPGLKGGHNLLATRDRHILANATRGKALLVFDERGRPVRRIELLRLAAVQSILRRLTLRRVACWLAEKGRPSSLFRSLFWKATIARPLFVRGLCETGRGTVLVGISPATILEIDWKGGGLVDLFSYSDDPRVCVHGIACDGS